MQLRFTLRTVTSSQRDLHPQAYAHAGRTIKKTHLKNQVGLNWLREKDLNLRPLGYEPNELPDCSIARQK